MAARLTPEDERNLHLWSPKWQRIARGEIDLGEFSDEEILTARVTLDDGTVRPAPRVLPSVWVAEQVKRGMRQAEVRIREGAQRSLEVYLEILEDPKAPRAELLKAAAFFTDRFLGKAPEQVKVARVDKIEELFAGLLQSDDDEMVPGDEGA